MASLNATVRNPRVVIIGAGFDGLSAAKRLARSHCRLRWIRPTPIKPRDIYREGRVSTQNPGLS